MKWNPNWSCKRQVEYEDLVPIHSGRFGVEMDSPPGGPGLILRGEHHPSDAVGYTQPGMGTDEGPRSGARCEASDVLAPRRDHCAGRRP